MKKLIILVALAFSGVISAQNNIEFEEYELDNGLHVILHEDKTTPIVAVTMMYHVGSKNEKTDQTGFAHFFEHLTFEGSENIERGEFDDYVNSAGGQLNANTSQDRTFYFELLPSNQLELGLWLESERMLHAKIKKIGVDTQREVVKEEKRQRYSQPYATFAENIFSRLYVEHPYNWTPIGSMEHLNAAELNAFMSFYNKFYLPNNATLSIAGDLDIPKTKELIKAYFGDIPKGKEVVQPTIKEPELGGEKTAIIYDDIQLPAVMMGYRMPPQTSDDAYALQMVSSVLSGGPSSRMYKRLVDIDQTALQVGAFPFSLEQGGAFITFSLANAGKTIRDMKPAIEEEIGKLQDELITEREFQKIQNQMESSFIQSNSKMAGIAESLANYHTYYGDANYINTEIERYRSVTREDIKRVAKKYLVKENRVVLSYLPKAQDPDNKTEN
ncbi:MAG: putative zinc protease [Owenweeksia sp. TMED14]|nr:MAG: putative zinc protease [Owenweeksia sp. TMED14]|tara:strand:+ start:2248 stop:3576 length:1329 start_codon:yes stop_codon:yes gene_type:complete